MFQNIEWFRSYNLYSLPTMELNLKIIIKINLGDSKMCVN